jgi:hypothetical protein
MDMPGGIPVVQSGAKEAARPEWQKVSRPLKARQDQWYTILMQS